MRLRRPSPLDTKLFVLALYVVTGYFSLTALLYWIEVPQANVAPINQLLGSLAIAFGGIIGYCFAGSIDSTKRREETAQDTTSSVLSSTDEKGDVP